MLPMRKTTRRLLPLTMGALLCLVPAAVGQAPSYYPSYGGRYPQSYYPPPPSYCPPMQVPSLPQVPRPGTLPAPERPQQQPQQRPETTRPGEQRPGAETQPQNQAEQPPESQPGAPDTSAAAAEAGATGAEAGAAEAAGAEAGLGGAGATASSAGMLGRNDMDNRFNLFDNMSPYLANRVWFSFEYQSGFNTGVQPNPTNPFVTTGFAPRRQESLYRFGAEIVPFSDCCWAPNFSIAFQDEYVGSGGSISNADAWANPEVLLKVLVCQNACGALSVTLGADPQTASHNGELHEKSTRLLPGVLFYEWLGCRLFVQGGFQAGISTRNDPNTIDYALSLGYWLYGCPEATSMDCYGCWVTGIIPQVEIYGSNVIANGNSNPFELPGNPAFFGSSAPFQSPRNIYDITAGGRIIFCRNVSLELAYSFPISGGFVRKHEAIAGLTWYF
jgi:hypothetical protein